MLIKFGSNFHGKIGRKDKKAKLRLIYLYQIKNFGLGGETIFFQVRGMSMTKNKSNKKKNEIDIREPIFEIANVGTKELPILKYKRIE